jgi:hypothetical protein
MPAPQQTISGDPTAHNSPEKAAVYQDRSNKGITARSGRYRVCRTWPHEIIWRSGGLSLIIEEKGGRLTHDIGTGVPSDPGLEV